MKCVEACGVRFRARKPVARVCIKKGIRALHGTQLNRGNALSRNGKVKIANMPDLGGVIEEMKHVYRDMRRGVIDTLDGKRLVDALTAVRQGMEVKDVESRIAALESKK